MPTVCQSLFKKHLDMALNTTVTVQNKKKKRRGRDTKKKRLVAS